MKFREIKTSDEAIERVTKALQAGEIVSGEYIKTVEDAMREVAGTDYAVAVSSGTMALMISLRAIGVGRGDFVLVPDVTFAGCATAVIELGAIPVFVDVSLDNCIMEEANAREEVGRFGDRLKAVMAVRLAGEPLPKWIYELGLPVIVDSAHSVEPMAFQAKTACFSFYPTKIVTGIEGGCIATNDPEIAAQARELRLFGFKEGTRIAVQPGYKGNMSNVSAALIAFNLGHLGANLADRERVRNAYNTAFGLCRLGLGMYMVTVEDPDEVCALIPAIRHYPVTMSEMFAEASLNPHARWIVKHLISLPFHEYLVDKDVETVCSIIKPRLINHPDQHGITTGSCAVQ